MKNKIHIILLAIFTCAFVSCDDFLDVKPANVLVVKTLNDVESVLGGYLRATVESGNSVNSSYPITTPTLQYGVHHYTDEFSFYQWGEEKGFDYIDNEAYARLADFKSDSHGELTWSYYYSTIGLMNSVIMEASSIENGEQIQSDYIMGEAYVWRAYSFFKLLQYFSPYNEVKDYPGNVEEFGVPVNTDSYSSLDQVDLSRRSQAEVYTQVLDDLSEANTRIERSFPNDGFNQFFNKQIINGLLAKVYWYKAMSPAQEATDWANAEKYSTQAMEGRSLTEDVTSYTNIFNTLNKDKNTDECPARFVHFGSYGGYPFQYLRTQKTDDSYTLYTDDDIRKQVFFSETDYIFDSSQLGTFFMGFTQNKYQTNLFTGNYMQEWWSDFRLSEMYLIKAEAIQRQGGDARGLLNEFQATRYNSGVGVSSADVLADILLERRKEFMYELDHRWIDCKRLAIPVSRDIDGTTYSLDGKDYRYSLKIPESELELNKNLEQNAGWFNQ